MDAEGRYSEIVADLLARHDDVARAKMMGMPCIKRGGKMVGGFWEPAHSMVFKLRDPSAREAVLALDGVQLFDPSGLGRPMKDWVQVPVAYVDRWAELARQALGTDA
jgi:hypothetical protein